MAVQTVAFWMSLLGGRGGATVLGPELGLGSASPVSVQMNSSIAGSGSRSSILTLTINGVPFYSEETYDSGSSGHGASLYPPSGALLSLGAVGPFAGFSSDLLSEMNRSNKLFPGIDKQTWAFDTDKGTAAVIASGKVSDPYLSLYTLGETVIVSGFGPQCGAETFTIGMFSFRDNPNSPKEFPCGVGSLIREYVAKLPIGAPVVMYTQTTKFDITGCDDDQSDLTHAVQTLGGKQSFHDFNDPSSGYDSKFSHLIIGYSGGSLILEQTAFDNSSSFWPNATATFQCGPLVPTVHTPGVVAETLI